MYTVVLAPLAQAPGLAAPPVGFVLRATIRARNCDHGYFWRGALYLLEYLCQPSYMRDIVLRADVFTCQTICLLDQKGG